MTVRGIRGATTVAANDPEHIRRAMAELLEAIAARNGVRPDDVAAVLFTATPDLNSGFPAAGARELGWDTVALLDAVAPVVPGAPERCLRVLVMWNTDAPASAIRHVYLHGARQLRPEWAVDPPPEPKRRSGEADR